MGGETPLTKSFQSEDALEALLFENPWLISDDFDRVEHVQGAKGIGRQVSLGTSRGLIIDLLFKHRVTGRPVIVELKNEMITRQHIGQVIEYGAGLRLLDEDRLALWKNEFGDYYSFPLLMLVGPSVDEVARAAANMVGVDVRTFETDPKTINIPAVQSSLEEYRTLRAAGVWTSLEDRVEKVGKVVELLDGIVREVLGRGLRPGKDYNETRWWWGQSVPLLDFCIEVGDDVYIGLVEFHNGVPYNDDHVYLGFYVEGEIGANRVVIDYLTDRLGKTHWSEGEQNEWFTDVPRRVLSSPKQLAALFRQHLKHGQTVLKMFEDRVDGE